MYSIPKKDLRLEVSLFRRLSVFVSQFITIAAHMFYILSYLLPLPHSLWQKNHGGEALEASLMLCHHVIPL
jgi:hypothetical protein